MLIGWEISTQFGHAIGRTGHVKSKLAGSYVFDAAMMPEIC